MKKNEQELFKYASFDMLTGVLNRRSGMEILSRHMGTGAESQEFILCYIDINDLKRTNDLYGHSTGDNLIKTCCETINRHLTSLDVLFRFGGDEFIIVFFEKNRDAGEELVCSIKRDLEAVNKTSQKPFSISASYGFYHYKPGTVVTLEEILEMADQEMYKEKSAHKSMSEAPKLAPEESFI
ncbi:GGDEF domain-containing protein [Neobacillus drentensis]|uniref:GGDEF domain-containing protein n=1 Tax=Neobacillus drentensis TaxID=220684 RepID=UPI002FFF88A7